MRNILVILQATVKHPGAWKSVLIRTCPLEKMTRRRACLNIIFRRMVSKKRGKHPTITTLCGSTPTWNRTPYGIWWIFNEWITFRAATSSRARISSPGMLSEWRKTKTRSSLISVRNRIWCRASIRISVMQLRVKKVLGLSSRKRVLEDAGFFWWIRPHKSHLMIAPWFAGNYLLHRRRVALVY